MTEVFIIALSGLAAAAIAFHVAIWRTTYENHAWFRMTHRITGEHRWVRKAFGGYSPFPWLDDDGQPRPPGPPPQPRPK